MPTISNHLQAAQAAVGAVVSPVAKAAGKGAVKVANIFTHAPEQRQALDGVHSGVDSLYARISTLAHTANDAMENQGETLLRSPIKGMREHTFTPYAIKEDMTAGQKSIRGLANSLGNYHQGIVRGGESISRHLGDRAHGLTRFALTPIRFIAQLLRIEVAGSMIQNAIALTVGSVVRATALAVSQLAHALPYIATAAVIGATGLGLAALAIFVNPLAAVGLGVGLAMLAQQVQLSFMSRDINDVKKAMKEEKKQPEAQPSMVRQALNTAYEHKGKIALAASAAALGAGVYHYGIPAQVTDAIKQAGDYFTGLFKTPASTKGTIDLEEAVRRTFGQTPIGSKTLDEAFAEAYPMTPLRDIG